MLQNFLKNKEKKLKTTKKKNKTNRSIENLFIEKKKERTKRKKAEIFFFLVKVYSKDT